MLATALVKRKKNAKGHRLILKEGENARNQYLLSPVWREPYWGLYVQELSDVPIAMTALWRERWRGSGLGHVTAVGQSQDWNPGPTSKSAF